LRHIKAGSVVVPLNFLLKAPEIAYQLADSEAGAMITWAGCALEASKGAADAGLDRIFVVNTPGIPEATVGRPFEDLLGGEQPGTPLLEQTEPGDTAAIMYTSGTTGRPKGAELSHFQLYMNAETPGRLLGIRDDDIVMVVLPLFHVFGSCSQLNACIRFGATMSLVPRFDVAKVLEVLQRDRIAVFEGVPTMYIALLNHPQVDDYDVSSLRVGISGGRSAVHPSQRRRGRRGRCAPRSAGRGDQGLCRVEGGGDSNRGGNHHSCLRSPRREFPDRAVGHPSSGAEHSRVTFASFDRSSGESSFV
jgi:long-chain acyl-CoA synthetase